MSLSFEEVGEILKLIEQLDSECVTLEFGDLKIHVDRRATGAPGRERDSIPTQPEGMQQEASTGDPTASTTAASSANGAGPEGCVAVTAPMVGVFYRAPSPDAEPFVEVGTVVKPGEQLAIVEVMKLMNDLTAEMAGRVERIDAANGELVDYGRTLMWLRPDA